MFFKTNKSSPISPLLATYIVQIIIIFSTVFVLPSQSATALEEIAENPGKKTRIFYKVQESVII